jgi:hypothetical protein
MRFGRGRWIWLALLQHAQDAIAGCGGGQMFEGVSADEMDRCENLLIVKLEGLGECADIRKDLRSFNGKRRSLVSCGLHDMRLERISYREGARALGEDMGDYCWLDGSLASGRRFLSVGCVFWFAC